MWTITISQAGTIRTQNRVVHISVSHDPFMQSFSVTIENPTWNERTQAKGRINDAIIQIKRGSEILFEGFIENVEGGADTVTYTGRSFLVLLGYSTSSETASGGATKAEYDDKTGAYIIDNLIDEFCVTKDAELTYTDITFTETYDGTVKLHGKKVYQIVKEMCSSYGKDIWSDATWNGDGINIDNKNIHVGTKSRGSSGSPYKTLRGGQHLKNIPVIKYKTGAEMMNCLRVIGKGEGKDQISVWCEDAVSIASYGYIEGEPYRSNMISKESTATAIGDAIIAAKKDPITQLNIDPAYYISDVRYGDWVNVIDEHSNIDTVKRIKKIVYIYNINQNDSMQIELGDQFNNYENIIADLTKGDVDAEKEMTLGGGSFRITPNTPANTYVRIEKGSWYGSDGVFYNFGTDSVRTFWGGSPPYNATTVDNYFKALIQIKDNAVSASDIEYKTSLTVGAHTGYDQSTAEAESISPDTGYTPLGEVILKCKIADGTVYDVEATDEGGSYIWRDVRPIIGSSSAGFSSGLWEVSGTYTQLITADEINIQGKQITNILELKGSLNSDFSLYGSDSADTAWVEFLQWDHSTEQILINRNTDLYDATVISPQLKFRVPEYEGYSGFYIDYHRNDGLLRFRNITADTDVVTFSDTGRVNLIDDLWMTKGKEINFGTPNTAYIYQDATTEDLKFYDTVLGSIKTLSELAAGGVPSGGIQGDIIYHNGADWVRLAAGTNGYILKTQGAAANPIWSKGLPSSPVQGDIIYYNGSNWASLTAGSSGSYLKTLGAGNNPIWFNVTAGFVTDPLTSNLDANGYDINDIGDLDFRTTLSYAYINFDSNDDFLRYDCGNDIFEFKIGNNIRFSVELEEINAYYNLDMNNKDIINIDDLIFTGSSSYIDLNGGDIIDCDEIKGTSTIPCHLDFRGDDAHRIWYTGSVDNKVQYKTYLSHEFVIQTTDVLEIKTTGIHMKTGKYIKSDSGDLELRAPSGSKIKFVIG